MISLDLNDRVKYLVIFSMFYLGGCAGSIAAYDTGTCTQRGGTVQDVCMNRDPNNLANCTRVERLCVGSMTHDEYDEKRKQKLEQKYDRQASSLPNKALTDGAYDGDAAKVRNMLEKGANVNHRDKFGGTALMNASLNGHGTIVKLLLEKGAKLDLQSSDGWTALMMASKRGHEAIVKMLLANGANVNIKFHAGGMAIDVAKTEKIRQMLKAAEVSEQAPPEVQASPLKNEALLDAAKNGDISKVNTLLEKGANVNHRSKNGVTALIFASLGGHEGVAKILLAKGAKVDSKTVSGVTALMSASLSGHEDVVKMLVAKGANVNLKDTDGTTALKIASQLGHEAVVKILLSNGADVSTKANSGETAFDVANTEKIRQLLKAAGAK